MANSTFRHLTTDTIDGAIAPKNYIKNAFARENTSGWATYANTAQSTPVTGTGGSPNVTLTRNTSSPLRNEADFLLTKDAANRQGQGVSYDFTIDPADKLQKIAIIFDYMGSANFVSGSTSDVQVFLYDVTNAKLLALDRNFLLTGTETYVSTFLATSSTSYRLIFHIATTNASAWTFEYINTIVGNATSFIGTNAAGPTITDWTPYTLVIGASTTPPTPGTLTANNAQWRRIGDSMEIHYEFHQTAAGSNGSGTYQFPIPSGYTIDTNKFPVRTGTNAGGLCGEVAVFSNGDGLFQGQVHIESGGTFFTFLVFNDAHAQAFVSDTFLNLANTEVAYSMLVKVPILNWTSNVAIANSGIFSISQILQNGTRVTGTPPTQLGQYRSYLRNAGADTYIETNGSPAITPTFANGIAIYNGNGFGSADTNNNPTKYDIFIGQNKSFKYQPFAATGRTGFIDTSIALVSTTSVGCLKEYDPTTGIITVFVYAPTQATTSIFTGFTTSNSAASSPSYFDITVADNDFQIQLATTRSELWLIGGNGTGATNTEIRRWSTIQRSTGSAITYTDSATAGASFTINEAGVYGITYMDCYTAGGASFGITLNESGADLTTTLNNVTAANVLSVSDGFANQGSTATAIVNLVPGDIIRGHNDNDTPSSTFTTTFKITKII